MNRAQSCKINQNDYIVIEEFGKRGIPASEIIPRVNVLSYRAWIALGRQVCKSPNGVKLHSFLPVEDNKGRERLVSKYPTVFHISQTIPVGSNEKPSGADNPLL